MKALYLTQERPFKAGDVFELDCAIIMTIQHIEKAFIERKIFLSSYSMRVLKDYEARDLLSLLIF